MGVPYYRCISYVVNNSWSIYSLHSLHILTCVPRTCSLCWRNVFVPYTSQCNESRILQPQKEYIAIEVFCFVYGSHYRNVQALLYCNDECMYESSDLIVVHGYFHCYFHHHHWHVASGQWGIKLFWCSCEDTGYLFGGLQAVIERYNSIRCLAQAHPLEF